MKKIIAIILAILTVFTMMSFSVSAADSTDVARMWVCSEISDKTGIGHVFLYFENLSDETITIGKYNVAPGGDVSVGLFGTEGPRGGGVYYNLETELRHYSQLTGLSTKLDSDELSKVSGKIRNYSNWWDPIFNCNYFALSAWNAGSDSDIPFLLFPGLTRFFIRMKGGVADPYDPFIRTDPVVKQTEL
ncbi:MAG: hypothetical protein IJN68_06635 [Clostridia bacterium]|nr:hypothetical protein [Clostridia bacterium]